MTFELNLSVPADARYGDAVRAVAEHGAQQAGCDPAVAAGFCAEVEDALHACARSHGGDAAVSIVLRCGGGEIEAVLTCGRRIRVARPVPIDV